MLAQAESPRRDRAAYGAGVSPRRSFALLCGATLFQFVALGIFLGALPVFISDRFGGSRTQVGLAMASFSVSAVLLRPWVGRGLDRYGRRWFLVSAPLILIVSAAGLSVARSIPVVVFLRLFQGTAGAAFYTAAATVATDIAPFERRATYIARFSLFLYGGFAIGPSVAERLLHRSFAAAWLAAALTATAAALLAVVLPETRPGRPAQNPARPRRFLHRASVQPGLVLMTAAVGYSTITTFSALYARKIGMSSGLLYLAFAGTVVGVRLFSGNLADRHGREAVARPGMAIAAAGLAVLAALPVPAAALLGVGLFGAGFALVFPALMALAADRVSDDERGEVLGSFTAFFDLGASSGAFAIGAVADRFGYAGAFATPSVLCLGGLALLLGSSRRRGGPAPEVPLPEPAGT